MKYLLNIKNPLNLTKEEEKERSINRSNYYRISKKLYGQNATFILIIKCDFEIINFIEDYFTKIKEGEYIRGGEVPFGGKKINVKLSRKKQNVNLI